MGDALEEDWEHEPLLEEDGEEELLIPEPNKKKVSHQKCMDGPGLLLPTTKSALGYDPNRHHQSQRKGLEIRSRRKRRRRKK